MTSTTKRQAGRRQPDSYMQLFARHPLRPIHSDAEYDAAIAVLDKLAVRDETSLDAGERDYLAVLTDLVGAYDDAHHAIVISRKSVPDRIASLMADAQLGKSDLARALGVSHSLVSLVLAGQREPSLELAKKLSERFNLRLDYFVSDLPAVRRSARSQGEWKSAAKK
jgi:HTH-type transcriptional regulator/antitoxin HigA